MIRDPIIIRVHYSFNTKLFTASTRANDGTTYYRHNRSDKTAIDTIKSLYPHSETRVVRTWH